MQPTQLLRILLNLSRRGVEPMTSEESRFLGALTKRNQRLWSPTAFNKCEEIWYWEPTLDVIIFSRIIKHNASYYAQIYTYKFLKMRI
jgi:hypothetical protein